MESRAVESSAVSRIGYEPETKILGVKFNDGGLYLYYPVFQDTYDSLMSANSIGRFVQTQIVANERKELNPTTQPMEEQRVFYVFRVGRDISSIQELREKFEARNL